MLAIKVASICAVVAFGLIAADDKADKDKGKGKDGKEGKKDPAAAHDAAPPGVQPSPEHAILKEEEGTWDASVEMHMIPGAPPQVSKGVETNTLGVGGLWLITDFKGEIGGQPFIGHGVSGYDPVKKKYVGTWVDSMSASLTSSEGTYDKEKRQFQHSMEGLDPAGQPMKWRSVTELKDRDTRIWTAYFPSPDGTEQMAMKITYKRRAGNKASR